MKKMRTIFLIQLLGMVLLAGPVLADTLVDNGFQTGMFAPSFAVDNGAMEYQKIEVMDVGGWTVTSLGLYSALVQDPNEVGMLVRILADDTGAPDEVTILAEETWSLTGEMFDLSWDYQEYNIFLPQGTYWIHCLQGGVAGDNYVGVVGSGTSGPSRWYKDPSEGTPPFEVDGSASLALIVEGTIGQTVATEDSSWGRVKSLFRD